MKLKFQRNYHPDDKCIGLQLAELTIQWTLNPPLAIVLGNRKLTISVFQTDVEEAEVALNSRPLTHVRCSIFDERPTTRNNFLCKTHMCLKLIVNINKWLSSEKFKLTQKLLMCLSSTTRKWQKTKL